MEVENKKTDLEGLAKEAETNVSESQFMTPGNAKKKTGRPPGVKNKKTIEKEKIESKVEETKQAVSGIDSKEIFVPLCFAASKIAVNWTEEQSAAMDKTEIEHISKAGGLLLDKYMPSVIAKYAVEFVFITSLGTWVMRVGAIKKVKELEKAQKEQVTQEFVETPKNPEKPKTDIFSVSEKTAESPPPNKKENATPKTAADKIPDLPWGSLEKRSVTMRV